MTSPGDQAIDTVVSTVGLWWPDAEEGDLRAAADAWDRMAGALDAAAAAGRTAADQTLAAWQGEAASVFAEQWAGVERDGIAPSADGCRVLAGALRQYADEVESAKHEIETLAVEIGAGLVLGAATCWLTFGASAAAAAGVAARRARQVFDRVAAELPWRMALTHGVTDLVASRDPERGVREFPPGTLADGRHRHIWASFE